VRLLAPVLPSKVIGFVPPGAERPERAEDGLDAGSVMYLKPSTAVCGPSDAISYPAQAHRLGADGKLAVIIGRLCRQGPPDQAAAGIFGYSSPPDVPPARPRSSR